MAELETENFFQDCYSIIWAIIAICLGGIAYHYLLKLL